MRMLIDMAGSNLDEKPGSYIAIDDGIFGEYSEITITESPESIAGEYLSNYDFGGDDSPVNINVVIYHNGDELEVYSAKLLPNKNITNWVKEV